MRYLRQQPWPEVEGIRFNSHGRQILDDLSLSFPPGEAVQQRLQQALRATSMEHLTRRHSRQRYMIHNPFSLEKVVPDILPPTAFVPERHGVQGEARRCGLPLQIAGYPETQFSD